MFKKILSAAIILCAVSVSFADLISQYDFEGTWDNSVEGGLAASARGGASLADDTVRGNMVNVDTTKWIHVGYDSNLDSITTQLSLCVWVRSTTTNWTANNRIMGRGYAWAIQVMGSATAGFSSAAGGGVLTGTAGINDGYWHHIAVTWDCLTGERKLYVDGVLDAEDEVVAEAISNYDRYAIGARATSSTEASNIYRGYIDDVRVYNSVLTPTEVYNIFSPPDPCVEQPQMDFTGDCVVDIADFAMFAQEWLFCGYWDQNDCQ